MAAIGKIRSWGPVLACVIGLALFAFIAEELVRSTSSMRNDSKQQVGEVLGKKISVQEYQSLMDEYQEVIKMTQGRENLSEEELNQVKDMVWNTYVQTSLIENEAKELGLTVTDQELQNVLKEGTNQMLLQTPFVNQQTGRFDANQLKQFLAEYKKQQTANPQQAQQYETIYKYWTFIEKSLRQQLLAQKYQVLLASCMLSNTVEAKMAFKDANEEANIQVAAFPYSEVKEADAKVTDADIKAKYEELKEGFRTSAESRDIKYVAVQVAASAADRQATMKQVQGYATQLATADDPSDIVRKSTSQIQYLGVPQSSKVFPQDIANRLDSMAVGSVYGPVENKQDNTLNVIRLYSKTQVPDSVQFRVIQVGGETVDAARTKADSIYNAIQGGADFEALAKKYNQTGEKTWLTGAQYENSPSMDKDTKTYLSTITTLGAGQTANVQLTSGNVIVQVLDRKAMTDKYVAAVIKRTLDFSKDTYSQAYNQFSSFVSGTKNVDDLQKLAKKNGYEVKDLTDITTAQHNIAGIRATREALKWLFDAEDGAVSPLYECGNNDELLVMVLTKVNPKGYRTLDDQRVKDYCKAQALIDKQAEVIMGKLNGVKSIAAAKAKGGKVADINQVTFASPAFVQSTGAAEPALSGAVAATKAGAFVSHPVKGLAGVYLFQVKSKKNRPGKLDPKAVMAQETQKMMQNAGNFMQELYENANVTDNRYLFF